MHISASSPSTPFPASPSQYPHAASHLPVHPPLPESDLGLHFAGLCGAGMPVPLPASPLLGEGTPPSAGFFVRKVLTRPYKCAMIGLWPRCMEQVGCFIPLCDMPVSQAAAELSPLLTRHLDLPRPVSAGGPCQGAEQREAQRNTPKCAGGQSTDCPFDVFSGA